MNMKLQKPKVYMNLSIPEKIREYKISLLDGIGLMRTEFIISGILRAHPLGLIERGNGDTYQYKLAEMISFVAKTVTPKPLIVRFSDLNSKEYSSLEGASSYEPKEDNPMIGLRGCSRYINEKFEQIFRLECRAIRKCFYDNNLKNIIAMLPFVRTRLEVEDCYDIMSEEGLNRNKEFKVWLMAEVPSVILLGKEFASICDGFSIGTNDLTQLIFGADRYSGILRDMGYLDENHPAVKKAIQNLIHDAHALNVPVSICGNAPSVNASFLEFLIEIGIDSVSVEPDMLSTVRKLVSEIVSRYEKELELNGWQ